MEPTLTCQVPDADCRTPLLALVSEGTDPRWDGSGSQEGPPGLPSPKRTPRTAAGPKQTIHAAFTQLPTLITRQIWSSCCAQMAITATAWSKSLPAFEAQCSHLRDGSHQEDLFRGWSWR